VSKTAIPACLRSTVYTGQAAVTVGAPVSGCLPNGSPHGEAALEEYEPRRAIGADEMLVRSLNRLRK